MKFVGVDRGMRRTLLFRWAVLPYEVISELQKLVRPIAKTVALCPPLILFDYFVNTFACQVDGIEIDIFHFTYIVDA